jgi:hypothetical protein
MTQRASDPGGYSQEFTMQSDEKLDLCGIIRPYCLLQHKSVLASMKPGSVLMLFIISNGFEKAGRATRAFQFAKVAKDKGHDVKVFLIDDAIHWAQLVMAAGVRASTGEEMKPFIDYLMGNGAEMIACKA